MVKWPDTWLLRKEAMTPSWSSNQALARDREGMQRFSTRVFAMKGRAEQIETNVLDAVGIARFTSRWHFTETTPDGAAIEKEWIATSAFRKGRDGPWRMAIHNSHGRAILTKVSAWRASGFPRQAPILALNVSFRAEADILDRSFDRLAWSWFPYRRVTRNSRSWGMLST